MYVFNRDALDTLFKESGFCVLSRDYIGEVFQISGVAELAVSNLYLLEKLR